MLTWVEWFIGLIPFAFIAFLLWIRLRVSGAPPGLAAKRGLGVFILAGLVILGIAVTARGWHRGNFWLLVLGGVWAIMNFWALKRKLQQLWMDFPLPNIEEGE